MLPDVFEEQNNNASARDGQVNTLALIDMGLDDKRLIENLNERIDTSKQYWEETLGYNLRKKRLRNLVMYLGLQVDESTFYDSEIPYIENQIRPAVEAIVAYCTARSPEPSTTKGADTPEATKFASDLRKALEQHDIDSDTRGQLAILVRNWLLDQVSYMEYEFDPGIGEHGEIVHFVRQAKEVVWDHKARPGQDPDFVAVYDESTVEDLLFLYPEKKKAIMDAMGMSKIGKRNITQRVVTKKVWFSYYEKGKKKQGIIVYFDDVTLIKTKDINWLENRDNFLKAPMKPIIPLTVLSDGKHAIDFSSFVDDGVMLQRSLNHRGRQIGSNADGSNGTKIINGATSGLTKEDAQNLTPGPNRTIFLRRAKGGPLKEMVDIIPAQDLPEFVVNDKTDIRQQISNVMAVPIDQTDVNIDPTLGQSLIKKNNANARQDEIIRGLDRFLHLHYNMMGQMMFVWYDADHFFTYEGVDGDFENICIKRYYFDPGMRAGVSGGTTVAEDTSREQAIAMKLSEKDKISNLDLYRILGLKNPQKLYDNWVKQARDPYELAKDANEEIDTSDAYAEMMEFFNGKRPEKQDTVSKGFVLSLRKLMVPVVASGKFRGDKVKRADLMAFIDRFNEYLEEYELKESLDQLGQEGLDKLPAPTAPIPPPLPPQQFAQMMAAPPPPPPGMGQPIPQGPPPGAMPLPGQMPPPPGAPPPGLFGGTGLPNPATPSTPAGIGAIPAI